MPYNFHAASDAFVSYYVKTGQLKTAWLVASLALRKQHAPIRDWVAAIQYPDSDHSARVSRFAEWGRTQNIDICDMGMVSVALNQAHCWTTFRHARLMWQPDTTAFRQTPEFKAFVNEHLMAFWQEWGFPPQCRDLGEGEFACD